MSTLHFRILNTHLQGTELTLTPPGGTLGRSRETEVCVRHTGLSSRHCSFRWDQHVGWLLADEDSTNGTWLNDQVVGRAPQAIGSKARLTCADLELELWTVATPQRKPVVEASPETMVYGVSLFKGARDAVALSVPPTLPEVHTRANETPPASASPPGKVAGRPETSPGIGRPSTLASLALELLDPDGPSEPLERPLPLPTATPSAPSDPEPEPVSLLHEGLPKAPPVMAPSKPPAEISPIQRLPQSAPETMTFVVTRPEGAATPSAPSPASAPTPAPMTSPVHTPASIPSHAHTPTPSHAHTPGSMPSYAPAWVSDAQGLRALVREGDALAAQLGVALDELAWAISAGVDRMTLEHQLELASLRLADFRSRLREGLGGER